MRQEKQEESNFMARPGQDLIMAGLAGLAGTREIACLHKEQVDRRISRPVFLKSTCPVRRRREGLRQVISERMRPGRFWEDAISAWEPVGEGGVSGCPLEFIRPPKGDRHRI